MKLKIVIMIMFLSAPLIAQTKLFLEEDHCVSVLGGAALRSTWIDNLYYPTCNLSSQHSGNSCFSGLTINWVETQVFTQKQHCITDWASDQYVTVTPRCGGTPSEEYHIINHTCCQ